MRTRLETCLLSGAVVAPSVMEAALVWWLWRTTLLTFSPSAFYFGDWVSPFIPGLSLAGVTAAMIHRLGLLLAQREHSGEHWHRFRRLVYPFLALASAGAPALYISFARFVR